MPRDPQDDGWDRQNLEMLITVCKEMMPPVEAQKVIATTLIKACLATVSETLDAAAVKVEDRSQEEWNDYHIDFEIDGVKLTLEVKTRE